MGKRGRRGGRKNPKARSRSPPRQEEVAADAFYCFGVIRRADANTCLIEENIAPRYATFHKVCDYIGLRTSAAEAWERVKQETMNPTEFLIFRTTFTAAGFLHYSTSCASPGVPLLHKMLYHDGQEWNCWRFNSLLPTHADCPVTGDPWVRVEFLEFET